MTPCGPGGWGAAGIGPPVTLWVDEDGFPVMGELLPGLVAERQPFEIATDATGDSLRMAREARPAARRATVLTSRPADISRCWCDWHGSGKTPSGGRAST